MFARGTDIWRGKALFFGQRVDNEKTVRAWQKSIIADAEAKLGRALRPPERKFIESRGGFIALEVIHDTVKAAGAVELERYLTSESS